MPNQNKGGSHTGSSMRSGTSAQHAKAGSMSHKNKQKDKDQKSHGSYSSGSGSSEQQSGVKSENKTPGRW